MKFCRVCGLNHFDDSPLCDPTEYRFGKIVTEKDGRLRYKAARDRGGRRSLNADQAEDEGRMPLTVAIPVVAHHAKCSEEKAEEALVKTHEGEWHHTGSRFKHTNYYSVARAVAYLRFGDAEKGE